MNHEENTLTRENEKKQIYVDEHNETNRKQMNYEYKPKKNLRVYYILIVYYDYC